MPTRSQTLKATILSLTGKGGDPTKIEALLNSDKDAPVALTQLRANGQFTREMYDELMEGKDKNAYPKFVEIITAKSKPLVKKKVPKMKLGWSSEYDPNVVSATQSEISNEYQTPKRIKLDEARMTSFIKLLLMHDKSHDFTGSRVTKPGSTVLNSAKTSLLHKQMSQQQVSHSGFMPYSSLPTVEEGDDEQSGGMFTSRSLLSVNGPAAMPDTQAVMPDTDYDIEALEIGTRLMLVQVRSQICFLTYG